MPLERSGFHPKSPEELETQAQEVSNLFIDQQIAPPSKKEDVLKMSPTELKNKFPTRYQVYLETLRDRKRDIPNLTEADIENMSKWLYVLNSLDTYIANHHSAKEEERTLRPKQISVFEKLRDFLESGANEGYIKLPTGSGKTVIFSEFVEAVGLKTLIVVPTKLLIEQTKDKLEEFTQDLDIGRIYADAKEHGRQVTIITYQSLSRGLKNGSINPKAYDFLVLDEVHEALSHNRMEAVRRFGDTIKIGFTATDKYSAEKQVSNLLSTEIHSMTIKEAVEEGMLCSFSVIIAETEADISSVTIKANGEYDEAELEKAINITSRNQGAVSLYKEAFEGEKAIVFCLGVAHAKEMARLFKAAGVAAEVIHGERFGEMKMSDQLAIKQRFASGKTKVICNSDILIRGFDEPTASVGINLRPVKSPVVAEQRGGRLTRLDKNNPNKHAYIVEFLDKDDKKRKMQTTFADVAGGPVIFNKKHSGEPEEDIQLDPYPRFRSLYGSGEPKISIEGLKVTTDAQEVLRILKGMIDQGEKHTPEGWVTNYSLATRFKSADNTIKKIADEFRNNSGWFVYYLDSNYHLREHYSPELVEIIEKRIKESRDDFNDPEKVKIVFDSTPHIDDLATCDLIVFSKTRFGERKISGHIILRRFGDGKVNVENLNRLLKVAGVDVSEIGKPIDYSNPKQLKKLLSSGPVRLIELSSVGYTDFKNMKFGGKHSGLAEVTGATILRNFGDGKENSENIAQLLQFVETAKSYKTPSKEKDKSPQIDYTKPEDLKLVLLNASPPIDFFVCTYQEFKKTIFGGGKTGFPEIKGQSLLRNFSGKESNEGLEELLRLAGFEIVRTIRYDSPELLRGLLFSNDNVSLEKINLEVFIKTRFGGQGTKFIQTNGRNILNNFGNKQVSVANLNNLLKVVGVNLN